MTRLFNNKKLLEMRVNSTKLYNYSYAKNYLKKEVQDIITNCSYAS